MIALVAISAVALGIGAAIQRRRESLRWRAAYHFRAWLALKARADLPIVAVCYNPWPEEKVERYLRERDPASCLAYRAARYHHSLVYKYHRASECPWAFVPGDPPPPPQANPTIEVKRVDYERIAGTKSNPASR